MVILNLITLDIFFSFKDQYICNGGCLVLKVLNRKSGNIKVGLKETGFHFLGPNFSSEYYSLAGSCERGAEFSGSSKVTNSMTNRTTIRFSRRTVPRYLICCSVTRISRNYGLGSVHFSLKRGTLI
jgi:hypothetical protein